jgi:four helix bundle protein
VHKLGVANKELRESLYWLRLLQQAAIAAGEENARLIREADELVAILTASIRTAKERDAVQ